MIILLYGKDRYRINRKVSNIVEEYKKRNQSGLNLVFLDAENSFKELFDQEKQIGMFEEKRLIVAKDMFAGKNLKADLLKNGKKIIETEDVILFYEEREIKKTDPVLSFLLKEEKKDKKRVTCQEFAPFSKAKLVSWIEGEFKKNRVVADRDVVETLALIGGENLFLIKNEIDKLSLYKKDIKKEDINLLTKIEKDINIFNTIDSIAKKDRERAIFSIYDHLQKGDNPLYLFSMIVFQFRNLILIRELLERGLIYNEIRKKLNFHPYLFQKSYKQAEKFTYDELKNIYSRLFEIDLKSKTGKIDPVLGLHLFLFNI